MTLCSQTSRPIFNHTNNFQTRSPITEIPGTLSCLQPALPCQSARPRPKPSFRHPARLAAIQRPAITSPSSGHVVSPVPTQRHCLLISAPAMSISSLPRNEGSRARSAVHPVPRPAAPPRRIPCLPHLPPVITRICAVIQPPPSPASPPAHRRPRASAARAIAFRPRIADLYI
ncbi:hypothetical protein TNIN_205151 [Trichonephila inaurata madagascariensis]|uniref:Uncharacterized protein n=1 Tax=Trichonephila inaurata madagascariensis TaxID=2747483 RepID=A0A8X6WWE0_9ARAC|nr:hypothetical protein TNIN_205151 [Trichonephila inaurata madagascariensis]